MIGFIFYAKGYISNGKQSTYATVALPADCKNLVNHIPTADQVKSGTYESGYPVCEMRVADGLDIHAMGYYSIELGVQRYGRDQTPYIADLRLIQAVELPALKAPAGGK